MTGAMGKLLLAAGLGLMAFTGYQAMIYRESLRLTQQEFDGLPHQLLLLLAAAAALTLLGGLQSSGELAPVSIADNPQPLVLRPNQIDFVTFNHRGQMLGALQRPSRGAGPASSAACALVIATIAMENGNAPLRIGVLALQGSFREHMALLKRVPGVEPVEVRTKEQLQSVAGLIIPGGESTTMALVAEKWGLIPELRRFAAASRPVWGTCAGLIFLADRATGMKEGGQALLGGLDCLVHRNFFGAQINSFEAALPAPPCLPADGEHAAGAPFHAVFIRAPAITEVGPGVEVLAEYALSEEEQKAAEGTASVIVAVRSGGLLATAFHPELTQDARWHRLFVDMVRQQAAAAAAASERLEDAVAVCGRAPTRPADMPVY